MLPHTNKLQSSLLHKCVSTSTIFSMLFGIMSGDVTRFSTAKTTPSGVDMPIAVEPN